jgi:hypothetical protein
VGTAAAGILIAHMPEAEGYASLPVLSIPLLLAAVSLSLFVSFSTSRRTAVSSA